MLYKVKLKHKHRNGEEIYEFTTYVEKKDIENYRETDSHPEDVAVQQSISKFFMTGARLYEGQSIEIIDIELIDDGKNKQDNNVSIFVNMNEKIDPNELNEYLNEMSQKQRQYLH